MSSGYVYQGLWLKWHGNPWTWTWTVTNLNAVFIMGVITVLLAVTQSRNWVIVRHLFVRSTQPNRLPDGLEALPQLTALKLTKDLFGKLFRPSIFLQRQSHGGDYKHPVWIGMFAMLNGLVFIAVGVILPWRFTDGALGAPEVRSQRTHNCTDSWAEGFPGDLLNSNLLLSSSTWEQCHDEKNAGSYCDQNFVGMKTSVASLRLGCIFPSQICLKSQPMVIFTRANLTAYDLGLNLNFKMTVSHRILCNPISLDPFIRKIKRPAEVDDELGDFTLSIQDPRFYNATESSRNLQLNMWTDNGPDSGLEMFRKKSKFFIQVLLETGSDIIPESSKYIHPLLTFGDAQTFVLILKAGGTMYYSPEPITDPLFQARRFAIGPESNLYSPDREATGIGCVEQIQICVDLPSGPKCYPWTKGVRNWPETLREDLRQFDDFDTVMECMAIFYRSIGSFSGYGDSSLQYFLLKQFILEDPLLAKGYGVGPDRISMITNINAQGQWILELAALFNKAAYLQKINFLAIVRSSLDSKNSTPMDLGKYSLCDRILFFDADFVNIDWIGMWIAVVVSLVLCVISYGISLLEWASQKDFNVMNREVQQQLRPRIFTWVQKELGRIGQMFTNTFKWVQEKLGRIRGIPHQNVPLSTLPAQARRLHDEEPDNTFPLTLVAPRRISTTPRHHR